MAGFRGGYDGSSFWELLQIDHAHLLPTVPDGLRHSGEAPAIPHGTTVLGLRHRDGVLVAGDRLATESYRVASRDVQKVYPTDDYSLMAIAGAAGPSIEMARALRVELEHYQKIEGADLELEGKANKLSTMIRQNLPAAMQGLVVVPIFAGYDRRRKTGRLWKYDVTGGRYEETDFEATGSGMLYARESLKKVYRHDLSREDALRASLEALADAADEDRGTGGVDQLRGIYPTVFICTEAGTDQVSEEEIAQTHSTILDQRTRGR